MTQERNELLRDKGEIVSQLKEETKETVSFLKGLLDTLEKERGWLYIGSGENEGFLLAMEIVKDKLSAFERSPYHSDFI